MSIEQTLPSDSAHRRLWVNYQLKLRGKTFSSVARAHGLSSGSVVAQVFDRPYPRMERIVAEEIGLTPNQLFPERYRPDGTYFRRGEKK